MSLIKCKECEHLISNKANSCPQCGYKKSKPKEIGIFSFLFLSFFIYVFWSMALNSHDNPPPKKAILSKNASKELPPLTIETEKEENIEYYNYDKEKNVYKFIAINFQSSSAVASPLTLTIRRLKSDSIILDMNDDFKCNKKCFLTFFNNNNNKIKSRYTFPNRFKTLILIDNYEELLKFIKESKSISVNINSIEYKASLEHLNLDKKENN